MAMSVSACIGAISLCCWLLGYIFYTQMLNWREPAILAAGGFMLLGFCTTVMCVACAIVEVGQWFKAKI